jgi:hypothetical protein
MQLPHLESNPQPYGLQNSASTLTLPITHFFPSSRRFFPVRSGYSHQQPPGTHATDGPFLMASLLHCVDIEQRSRGFNFPCERHSFSHLSPRTAVLCFLCKRLDENANGSATSLLLLLFCGLFCDAVSSSRPWRPIGLLHVEAPTFSKQSAHSWR